MNSRIQLAARLLFVLLLTSCAFRRGGNGLVDIPIVVENNLVPSGPVTVFLVPRSGVERQLGEVMPSRTDTLRYRGLSLSGDYQLTARTIDNRSVRSPIIMLGNRVASIEWSLYTNSVNVKPRELE